MPLDHAPSTCPDGTGWLRKKDLGPNSMRRGTDRHDEVLRHRPMSGPAGDPEDDADDDSSRSRTEERRQNQAFELGLMERSAWLVKQSDKTLAKLNLPEDALHAVQETRRIENPSARKRSLRLVRTALRAMDVEELRRRIEDLAYAAPKSEQQLSAERWAARLVDGGESELSAFVEAHPAADRQRFRALVRNVKKAPEAKAAETKTALTKAVAQAGAEATAAAATENDEDAED
jgi:ribosome-associated protein